MKKLYFALFTFLPLCVALAQKTSNLIVFSEDAAVFYLYINGVAQNKEAKSNIKVTGITNPSNAILIEFADSRKGKLSKNIYFQEMGVEATTKITYTKKGYKLRYFGEVPISNTGSDPSQWVHVYNTEEIISTGGTSVNQSGSVTTSNGGSTNAETKTIDPNGNSLGSGGTGKTPTGLVNQTASNANAMDLAYKWTAGSAYTFQTTQTDDVSTSMMGMNMKDRFTTTSEFVLFINQLTSNGGATGWLYLIDYRVTDSRGAVLAGINDLPRKAVQSEFYVDRKGHFTFPKKLTLITSAQGNVLAYVKPEGNGMSMGGQAGDMKVDAYVEFDPKTGNLKGGMKVSEIKGTHTVTVKMNEETDMLDVLPYDYLELLALPEGVVAQGDQVSVQSGIYTTNIAVESMMNGNARLNYTMKTDKSQDPATGKMNGGNSNSGNSFGMDAELMGMPQMGSVDPQGAAMMNAASPTMTCNINSDFSYASGMFNQVSGVVSTQMDMMGFQLTVNSNLMMKKL